MARQPSNPERGTLSISKDDPGRPPLPAGDAVAWAVLTERSWLAGTSYPLELALHMERA